MANVMRLMYHEQYNYHHSGTEANDSMVGKYRMRERAHAGWSGLGGLKDHTKKDCLVYGQCIGGTK